MPEPTIAPLPTVRLRSFPMMCSVGLGFVPGLIFAQGTFGSSTSSREACKPPRISATVCRPRRVSVALEGASRSARYERRFSLQNSGRNGGYANRVCEKNSRLRATLVQRQPSQQTRNRTNQLRLPDDTQVDRRSQCRHNTGNPTPSSCVRDPYGFCSGRFIKRGEIAHHVRLTMKSGSAVRVQRNRPLVARRRSCTGRSLVRPDQEIQAYREFAPLTARPLPIVRPDTECQGACA